MQAGLQNEEDIRAQQAQYGLANQGQMMNMLNMGLNPQFENQFIKRQPGAFEQFGASGLNQLSQGSDSSPEGSWQNALGQIAKGAAGGGMTGGPWGAAGGGLMAALPFLMQLLSSNSNSLSAQPGLMRAADSRRRG